MTIDVFRNGRILTMDPRRPRVDELHVADGRIIDPDTTGSLLRGGTTAVVHDLAGRSLVPGLIDAHHHLSLTSLVPRFADLDGCTTFEEVAERIIEQAAREPTAAWIRGEQWEAPPDLTAAMLDELGLDRPVIVAHRSVHQCVVDSSGLERLGFGNASPDPDGGLIRRDPHGNPTGVLVEKAWSMAHAASIGDYTDPDRWGDLMVARGRELLASGVTCVHDAACAPDAEAVYTELARSGRLPLSVVAMPHPTELFSDPDPARLAGPQTGAGDEWVRVGAIKLFADGGMSMAVDAHRRGSRRVVGTPFPSVVEAAVRAADAGFGIAIHAMGNAGLELALAAFEAIAAAGIEPPLQRVEHLALASTDQLDRLADTGAHAVVQPGFVPMLGPNVAHITWDDATWLPYRSALERGVQLAGSTDAPCAGVHPLEVSCHGASRTFGADATALEPDESVDYQTWLAAWTRGAAAAGGQHDERGRLVPGLRADLVVLDGALDPESPPSVAETWVAGRRVYGASTTSRP